MFAGMSGSRMILQLMLNYKANADIVDKVGISLYVSKL